MASIISAGTTSGTALNFSGDTTGNLELKTGAGANTITVPNSTGTLALTSQLPVAGPAFSAYMSSNLDVTSGTITKVPCNTEEFDTNSCYDNTTNYRFTPNVAGYYQVTVSVYYNTNASSPSSFYNLIYKNGTAVKTNFLYATTSILLGQAPLTALIYMNGSTDYLEFYARSSGGTSTFFASGSTNTFFQAFLARSA
jgi:hypothetical protein